MSKLNFGIIAAGEGSRLAQEGVKLPKPLVKINGIPMIQRLISIFCRCGAASINVIINNEMKEVRSFLEEIAPALPCEFKLIVKTTESSMHSFYELARIMKGRFVVTTVDTIFREDDFMKYASSYINESFDIDGLMGVTSYIDDEKPLYLSINHQGFITGYYDMPFADSIYISGGIYGLSDKCLPLLERMLHEGTTRMRNFQRALVLNGFNLKAFNLGKIVDVDHAADIAVAESFLNQP